MTGLDACALVVVCTGSIHFFVRKPERAEYGNITAERHRSAPATAGTVRYPHSTGLMLPL